MIGTTERKTNNLMSIECSLKAMVGRIEIVQNFYKNHGVTTVPVGSLGRMISVENDNLTLVNPLSGRTRDIDLMCIKCSSTDAEKRTLFEEAKNLALPFTLEEHFDGKVQLYDEGATIRYKDIVLSVNPRIFGIRNVQFSEFNIDTLDPRTLFHLTALYGPMKPKDFLELISFGRHLRRYPQTLPEEFFEPFHDIAREVKKRYPTDILIGKLRWLYHRKVPFDKRVTLSRIVIPVRRIIKPVCGWIEAPHLQKP